MKRKQTYSLSTTQIIMLSFLLVIALGSVLLALPISSADGKAVPFIDALFTATTATCVTGLVTVTTATAWSTFGHVVILILIQVGGLGVITILSWFMLLLHRRMGLKDRLLIQDAFNLNSMAGLGKFIKSVVLGTLTMEFLGALAYMTVFVPEFGVRGIWISVFNSVSAFCNAGMDIIGENSLCNYALNPVIGAATSLLIILGGIGYIVWWDILRVVKNFRRQGFTCFKGLTLHSKIALSSTIVLIFVGAAAILLLEWNNPLTLQRHSFFDKVQLALFQSITTRTAGFATLPQQDLTNGTSVLSLLLMFIGGSPVGTAGGVKTVTITVLLISAFSTIRGQEEVSVFHRHVSRESVAKAAAVVCMSFVIVFLSTLLLSAVTDVSMLDVLYESVSAAATVGLSRNLTPFLTLWGKIIIIITMYLGRVGPISLAIAFNLKRQTQNIILDPIEDISIG